MTSLHVYNNSTIFGQNTGLTDGFLNQALDCGFDPDCSACNQDTVTITETIEPYPTVITNFLSESGSEAICNTFTSTFVPVVFTTIPVQSTGYYFDGNFIPPVGYTSSTSIVFGTTAVSVTPRYSYITNSVRFATCPTP